MNKFKVNGKEYNAKPIEFNTICDLEDMGVSIAEGKGKSFSLFRAYFALCAGKDIEFATKEIQAHIVGGGSIKDISEAMDKEMDKSDFFQALKQSAEENITEGEEAETEKKK